MQLDLLKITQESEEEFKNIAEKLFNNFAIQTKDAKYRLTEIEFYWKSPTHNDKSTYERIHVNPSSGEWFFHYSGVDIALKNEEIQGYGGILLRGIYNITSGHTFKGPQICAMKLFSGINAFSESFPTRIIEYNFPEEQIRKTERIGLGENAKKSGFDKFKYRFIIKPNDKR